MVHGRAEPVYHDGRDDCDITKEWTSKTNYMIVSVITPRVEAVALYSPVYGKYDPA
jgi:hypothetical protein